MPSLFTVNGFRFYFYSPDCSEPIHVHVDRGEKKAKIWIRPLEVAWNRGYNTRELKEILGIARTYQATIVEKWHDHCASF